MLTKEMIELTKPISCLFVIIAILVGPNNSHTFIQLAVFSFAILILRKDVWWGLGISSAFSMLSFLWLIVFS